jgi:signal transduction histidine kinase/DNA-binding response OmpR family regulator
LSRVVDVRSQNPELRWRGRLLSALILVLMLGILALAGVNFLRFADSWRLSHILGSVLALMALAAILWINKSGRVRLAGWLYGVSFVLAVSCLFRIEALDRVMVLYIVPTMGASFVLFPAGSFALATLSVLGYSLAYALSSPSIPYNYISSIGLYLAAWAAWLAARNLERAARETRQRANELDRCVLERTRDLTEALARERAESDATQAVLQSIGDGVMVLDQSRRVTIANPAVYALLERDAASVLSHTISEVMGDAVSQEDQAILRSLIEGERVAHAGLKIAWGHKTMAVSLATLDLPVAGQRGSLVILRDITQEAQVDRMKNEFVSIVSHELRTPMTSIKGYVDMLAMGAAGAVTEKQHRYLDIIKTSADRLSEMVDELLDLSRIEAGKVQMNYQSVSLPRVLHEVVAMLQKNFDDRNIQLHLDIPDDLADVLADPGRLNQIVTNLLSNALKYTFEGHVEVRVRVADGQVQVDVSDTGIGMSKEDQAKLFTRFFRASTARAREISGSGLGLSIARSLIEMQGGRIWVESAVGQGSTFSFTIPTLPESLAHMAPTEPPPAMMIRPRATPSKILVVDDELPVAQALCRQLEAGGYTALISTRGTDVLPLARREQPNLILLDVTLSDIDGFEALRQIKQGADTRSIPVIITSVTLDREKSLALGAADCLVKPVGDHQLLTSVQRVLAAALESEMPRSVLVVDDEEDIRQWLSLELSSRGFLVAEAQDGEAALAAIAAHPPHLIMLDLEMPKMDGWAVIQTLKENPQTARIPIIVLMASMTDLQPDKMRVSGMSAEQFLTKPLSVKVLVTEIKKQLAL